jgi:proteic killer suppression protein
MEISFEKEYLRELYTTGKTTDNEHCFPPEVVEIYCQMIDLLESVAIVEDLYRYRAVHYQELQGDKEGIESVNINDRYRIEFISNRVYSETVATVCDIVEFINPL